MAQVAILLAVHNRRETTLRALRAAAASLDAATLDYEFFLFDDGSTDGTGGAVMASGLPVTVVRGDGNAFWAAGMARAESVAQASEREWDAIVWLNDDVDLDPDAFTRLWGMRRSGRVLVGSVRELSGEVSYSGYVRRGMHPLRLGRVLPSDQLLPLDTFNGNLVIVPSEVSRRVGSIDGTYAHQLADIDYGLRVVDCGFELVLAPGTFGVCPSNGALIFHSQLAAWRHFLSRKGGGHLSSMVHFLRKRAPLVWPAYVLQSYVLWWARAFLSWVKSVLRAR